MLVLSRYFNQPAQALRLSRYWGSLKTYRNIIGYLTLHIYRYVSFFVNTCRPMHKPAHTFLSFFVQKNSVYMYSQFHII